MTTAKNVLSTNFIIFLLLLRTPSNEITLHYGGASQTGWDAPRTRSVSQDYATQDVFEQTMRDAGIVFAPGLVDVL